MRGPAETEASRAAEVEAQVEAGRVAAAREQLPSCAAADLYLNIGGAGPLPRAAQLAVAREMERAVGGGRATLAAVARMEELAQGVRSRASSMVGGRADEVALTGNTTQGVDVAIWGYDWRAGDEVVTTGLEHPGVTVPLGVLARRMRVRVRQVAPAAAARDLGGAVAALAGPRTRMVVVSHVAYGTGEVLDVSGAADAAHAVGALCVVDGAQSAGAIPVDAAALGVDAYAFPAHKWLYGPEGLGALWVAPHAVERIHPSFSGYESGTGHTPDGEVVLHPGARRYEISTPPMALLGAWAACMDWMADLGWGWIHERIRRGQGEAWAALAAIPGVRMLTPEGRQAGLVTFAVDGWDAPEACAALAANGVLVRWLEHPAALRASIGFHWCQADVERLALAVATLREC